MESRIIVDFICESQKLNCGISMFCWRVNFLSNIANALFATRVPA